MKKYKILLCSFYNTEAYGLRILHSILTSNPNYEVNLLFINSYSPELIVEIIKTLQPSIVGFSLVSPNFVMYKKVYPIIRKTGNFKIILGGWQSTLNPEECLSYCDALCRGEGENIIEEMIYDLLNSKNKKVYMKSLNNNINYPELIFDDKHTFSIDNGKIKCGEPYFHNTRYGTMYGRGCPYSCTYCSNSYMKNVYPNWSHIRYRDINNVMDELIYIQCNLPNVERINFYDEIFIPKKEFIEEYKRLINLPFYCMFCPGTCSDKSAKDLKEAGLTGVWLGIQSGSERVRKEIFKRYYTNDQIRRQVDIFKKYDISIKYDIIFDNPWETKEETQETIDLMKELDAKLINMFSLKFFPNTEITKRALDEGLINNTDDQLDINKPEYCISQSRQEQIWNDLQDRKVNHP